MKYFLDTEFIEDGKTIDLLSIGIICEDGREYYAENKDADLSKANSWVLENVICNFKGLSLPKDIIKKDILKFVNQGPIEFWGYFSDYDWVVFCQLFGTMMNLPKGFPMFCLDLKQELVMRGHLTIKQEESNHNALDDARWVRDTFIKISNPQVK